MRTILEKIESLKIAFAAIKSNKSRAILTTLGIVIGIVAVTTTMTTANSLVNNFKESAAAIGTDVYYVSRMPWIFTGNFADFRNRQILTFKQGEKLKNELTTAKAVIPSTGDGLDIKYQSRIMGRVPVIGTTEQQVQIMDAYPKYGRFITSLDVQYKKFVCVIGAEIKEEIFKNVDPLNKDLKIGRYKFRIIGVMEKRGSAGNFGGPNFDRQIFVPISAFIKAYGGFNRQFDIAVKVPDQADMENFKYEIIGQMRQIRKLKPNQKDDFSINSLDSLMNAFNSIMGVVVLIGLLITSISLFVGAIGVMNIMFVSVTERTREIGIRKAIGAKSRTILTQFLFESSAICLIGGFVGLGLSFGIAKIIDTFLMPASVSIPVALISIFISILVGVLSGLIPALKAARLNPIDALHYE